MQQIILWIQSSLVFLAQNSTTESGSSNFEGFLPCRVTGALGKASWCTVTVLWGLGQDGPSVCFLSVVRRVIMKVHPSLSHFYVVSFILHLQLSPKFVVLFWFSTILIHMNLTTGHLDVLKFQALHRYCLTSNSSDWRSIDLYGQQP